MHFWIIALNGKARDIRPSADLALRQGRVVKAGNPLSVVTLHYGEAKSETVYDGTELVTTVSAELSDSTIIATFN